MSASAPAAPPKTRRFGLWRLAIILFATAAAGFASDWLRPNQRLLFPRALPDQSNSECK